MNPPTASGEVPFRFAAFLVTGLVWLVLLIFLTLVGLGIPLGDGDTVPPDPDSMAAAVHFINRLALVLLVTVPMSWFIVSGLPLKRSGQTLGMKFFGLKAVGAEGDNLGWGRLLARTAILAVLNLSVIGTLLHLLVFFDVQRRTAWDRLSRTAVVAVPAKLGWVNRTREQRAPGT